MTAQKHHPDRCNKKGCKSCLYRKEIRCPVCKEKKTMFRDARYCSERCRLKAKYKRRKMLGKVKTVNPQECCVDQCHGTPVKSVVLNVGLGTTKACPVCERHKNSELEPTMDGRILVGFSW